MNAAFLLVTTAWIAGADAPPPAAPPPAAAPVYSVGHGGCAGGGCGTCGGCTTCGGCDSCCESEGLLSKLKGLFHRNDCGCGCDSGCGCESEGLLSRFKHRSDCCCSTGCGCTTGCGYTTGCGCGNSCDTCGSFGGGRLRDKLRGLFNHGDCGCDTCGTCGGCAGGCGTITTVPLKPEPLGKPKVEPKKLPSGDQPPKGNVQLIPQPIDTPDLNIAPTSGKSPF